MASEATIPEIAVCAPPAFAPENRDRVPGLRERDVVPASKRDRPRGR